MPFRAIFYIFQKLSFPAVIEWRNMTFHLALNSIFFFVALLILARAVFYDDLGISRKATLKEIKKAYRSKSLEFHPDKNKAEGAADKFGEISRAYEVLSDEEKVRIFSYLFVVI